MRLPSRRTRATSGALPRIRAKGAGTAAPKGAGDKRRLRILRAARTLFARQGFAETTTRQIAAASRSNVASIRYYFGDKAGLVAAVMREVAATMLENGAHPVVPVTNEPREALKQFVLWVLRTARRGKHVGSEGQQLMLRALAIKDRTARQLVAEMGDPVRANLFSLIDQLYTDPIDADVREHAFVFIFSLCSNFVHGGPALRNMGIEVPDDESGLDQLAERLTDFIIGGVHNMTTHAMRKRGRA
ncbi:MAG TPA: TetR/AcrR family transcriptional regulator [Phycisphaerales bacterium]|nr:TetR/AcrR family transcriptional regulator [Phycisphaerales bacterium]